LIPARAAWAALAGLLAGIALCGALFDPAWLEWQAPASLAEPWRAWTAVAVHYSRLHLTANLIGTALVGALGVVGGVGRGSVAAWFVAWPLTQFGLGLRPDLAAYGGLSGVLHAGVAVAAVHLVAGGHGRQRLVGVAILVGLALKVVGEAPWGPALRRGGGWDIAIAPFAHASGTVAGLVCALAAWALARRAQAMAWHG
jgi:hypothetical protein